MKNYKHITTQTTLVENSFFLLSPASMYNLQPHSPNDDPEWELVSTAVHGDRLLFFWKKEIFPGR